MRPARRACTVAGTWITCASSISRKAPRSPARAPVSTRVRTLSSRKNGLPSVRSMRRRLREASPAPSPTKVRSSSSALSGRKGSILSWQ